jgi:hypothetical protein
VGFNKRKMEDRRHKAAEQEAAARRALGPQIIEDSVKLVPIMPAECAVRRTRVLVEVERCRGVLRRAQRQ